MRGDVLANGKAAIKLLLQRFHKRKEGPIRVGFLCQYIPAWNKVEPIYAAMRGDSRFEPVLICVPSQISEHQLQDPESTENDTYDYYVEHGYDAVNALIGKNEWLELASLELDYLFCLRPYDYHMPIPYISGALSKRIKLCVILYGMMMVREDADVVLKPEFFRDVYCYFAESDFAVKLNRKKLPVPHFLGLQKSVYYGIPAMSQIMEDQNKPTDAWDFCENGFRVMWTPRWTTDLKLGGTNFFQYKDWILDYAETHADVACLLRPHPLAFENFVRAGDMTQTEVDAYKARCQALANVQIDTRKEYITTMWKSSALIGDISGILPEYFIMNKPLIFCSSNMILAPTDFTKWMLEGCYVVDNRDELMACLEMLRKGEDPLKQKREAIIEELFGSTLHTAVESILEELERGV